MNKESLVKEQVNFQSFGEQIPHELGKKMVKDHHALHGFEGSSTFIMGREIIEKALSQPGCVGFRLFDAVDESGKKTLVCMGIDSNGKNIIEYSVVNEHGEITVTEGMVWDRILPPSTTTTDYPPYWLD